MWRSLKRLKVISCPEFSKDLPDFLQKITNYDNQSSGTTRELEYKEKKSTLIQKQKNY